MHVLDSNLPIYNSMFETGYTIYEGGSESSVIGVISLLIDMIDCCIIP